MNTKTDRKQAQTLAVTDDAIRLPAETQHWVDYLFAWNKLRQQHSQPAVDVDIALKTLAGLMYGYTSKQEETGSDPYDLYPTVEERYKALSYEDYDLSATVEVGYYILLASALTDATPEDIAEVYELSLAAVQNTVLNPEAYGFTASGFKCLAVDALDSLEALARESSAA